MKRRIFTFVSILSVLLASTVIVFLGDTDYEKSFYAMAAPVSLKIKGGKSKEACEEIVKAIIDCENKEISRNVASSDVSRINENKSADVSENTISYLLEMVKFSENCGGAVDLTIGKLTEIWGIGSNDFAVPGEEKIKNLVSYVDYTKIKIKGKTVKIGENQSLDFGSIGKGIACDIASQKAKNCGVKRVVVSVGGSVFLWNKNAKEEFTIGVRDPRKGENDYALSVKTGNTFVSTSGTYERYSTDQSGKTYHHILSPFTGYPAETDIVSVSVFCQSGMLSDALSSACLILGYEKSEELLKKYNAYAVYIFKDDTVKTSGGFPYEIKIKDSRYVIK